MYPGYSITSNPLKKELQVRFIKDINFSAADENGILPVFLIKNPQTASSFFDLYAYTAKMSPKIMHKPAKQHKLSAIGFL